MKKTFATFLAVVLVASVCGVMFVSAEEVNIAAGKNYTISQQFRQGADYSWDDNADIAYPDEGGTLTDGVYTVESAGYGDAAWAGFTSAAPEYSQIGYSYINVDLGASSDITKFVAYLCKDSNAGVAMPSALNYYVSNDGENYELAGTVTPTADENGVHSFEVTADVNARYVELRMTLGGWGFISELEVYGTSSAAGGDESSSEDESSAEAESSTEAVSSAEADSSIAAASSEPVAAGDSGIVVFAVLGVVAIAGAAVAIKSRH